MDLQEDIIETENDLVVPSATPLDVRADGHFVVRNYASKQKYYRGRVMVGIPARERALNGRFRTASEARLYAWQVAHRYYRLFYAGIEQ